MTVAGKVLQPGSGEHGRAPRAGRDEPPAAGADTARPEGEPWMIQKTAYAKILKAFRDAGNKFAHRQVTVNVPQAADGEKAALAAEGAAALAAQAVDEARS